MPRLFPMALFATSALLLAAPPAQATDDRVVAPTCDGEAVERAPAEFPDELDPTLRGVGLTDLPSHAAHMVSEYLRLPGTLPLNEVLSTSIVELRADALIVDVVGRARRFDDTDKRRHPEGRVGILRARVPVRGHEQLCDVGAPTVIWQRSLTDLDLRVRVSILDWVFVLEDQLLGFRRVVPIGGGGIDRGVREVGVISSMTPTTEDGLLEKRFAWRKLNSPWYFRNKPYLPISHGRTLTRADGTTYKVFGETKIAFHIWQDKGFERGFFSHGCMRMRTEDLDELAAMVFGQRAGFPLTLRLDPITDARHPYPMDQVKYWQLKNYGTVDQPRFRMKYMLHEMELGTEPLPAADEFVPFTFASKPILSQ